MKNNKSKRIINSVNDIGDDLLNEALQFSAQEPKQTKRRVSFKRLIISAAAVVLAVSMLLIPEALNGLHPSGNLEHFISDVASVLPKALQSINVTLNGGKGYTLSPDGSIIVETDGECSAETLAEYVKLTPNEDLSITKLAADKFELSPASGGFAPGSVYRLTVGDAENPVSSYAFQIESEFCVRSVLPGDLKTDIPVDTGIEVSFSDAVGENNLAKYISVSPKVDGDFIVYPNRRTVAFVPTSALSYSTVYTITVKEGLKAQSGKALAETMLVKFRTAGKAMSSIDKALINTHISFSGGFYYTDDAIDFIINGSKNSITDFKVSLYKYVSVKQAYDALTRRLTEFDPSDENAEAYSADGLIHINDFRFTSSDLFASFTLGSGYEAGVYLAMVSAYADGTEIPFYDTVFQVTSLREFHISSNGKTLLWLNSEDGAVVPNAEIAGNMFDYNPYFATEKSLVTPFKAKTDAEGKCEIDFSSGNAACAMVTFGGESLICTMYVTESAAGSCYNGYVYTDRETYFTSDKVNIYGFIAPSYTDTALPDALYLKTNYSSDKKQKLDLNPDGSFSGSYSFEDFAPGNISIIICDGYDNIYTYKYIRISGEEKPIITAEIEFDKLFYLHEETVTATLKARFFDGTPASGFEFTLNASPFVSALKGVTDKEGIIKFSFETGIYQQSLFSTYPITLYVTAELTGMETQKLVLHKTALYFHSDYCFNAYNDDDKAVLTLSHLDTSALKTEEDLYKIPENVRGENADGRVKVMLKKCVITKTESTVYNPTSKKNEKRTKYSSAEYTVETKEYTFKDGKIELPYIEVEGFNGYYFYSIFYYDNTLYEGYSQADCAYTVECTLSASKNKHYSSASEPQYNLSLNKKAYSAGEKIEAQLYFGNVKIDRALFVMISSDIKASISNTYNSVYESEYIPFANLYAVYFDAGRGIYCYAGESLAYDYAANSVLTPAVTADKAVYKPGETATLKIMVDGAANGSALISVVDEACFALGNQIVSTAEIFFKSALFADKTRFKRSSLYRVNVGSSIDPEFNRYYRYYGRAELLTSESNDETDKYYYDSETGDFASESTYIRSVFASNPQFKIVKLNGDGEGTLTYTVPDNITTWRVTAIAVSGLGSDLSQIKVGHSVTDTVCTQPFFINHNVCAQYLTGDDAVISLRGSGSEADGSVIYKATLCDESGKALKTLEKTSASVSDYAWMNFGKLSAGEYSVTATAVCGNNTDGVKLTFSVVESCVTENITKVVGAEDIAALKPVQYPVTLSFANRDENYGLCSDIITRLLYTNDYARSDLMAARYIALTSAQKLYGSDTSDDADDILRQLKDYGKNFVSLMSYGSDDVLLTARLAALDKALAGGQSTVSYCYSMLALKANINDKTLCAALLLTLSALGEPVLDELYSTMQSLREMTVEAKLYLSAAFVCIGDYSAAADIYDSVRKEKASREDEFGTLCFKGETNDDTVMLSSLAMMSASRIRRTDATDIARYLMNSHPETEKCETALAMYVRYFIAAGSNANESSFTYSINGESTSTTVAPNRIYTLTLDKKEFESFALSSIDDSLTIRASYLGSASDAEKSADESSRVSVTKNISEYRSGAYLVTLHISGSTTRVYERFDITDFIPTGARFLFGSDGNRNDSTEYGSIRIWTGIYNTYGQKMRGCVSVCNENYVNSDSFVCPEYSFECDVTYVIRGAAEGEFIAESASVISRVSGFRSTSNRIKIVIKSNSKWDIKSE